MLPSKGNPSRKQQRAQSCSINEIIKKFDAHGSPVAIKYNGEETYQTPFGGILSIISGIGMLVYLILSFLSTQNFKHWILIETYKYLNTLTDTEPILLNEENFDFAFILNNYQPEYPHDEYDLYLITRFAYFTVIDEGSKWRSEVTFPSLEPCPNGRFRNETEIDEVQNITNNYLCLKDLNLSLYGNIANKNSQYGQIKVDKCFQEYLDEKYPGQNKTCKNDSEIEAFTKSADMSVLVLSSYFDEEEFEGNPVKPTLNSFWTPLSLRRSKVQMISITENYATTKNSWLSNSIDVTDYDFHLLNTDTTYIYDVDYKLTSDAIFSYLFQKGLKVEEIVRTRTTVWDAFSEIGGLMGLAFRSMLLNFITFKDYILDGEQHFGLLFQAKSVMSKLYRSIITQVKNNLCPLRFSSKGQDFSKFLFNFELTCALFPLRPSSGHLRPELQLSCKCLQSDITLSQSSAEFAISKVLNRVPFTYTVCDEVKALIAACCCRKESPSKQKRQLFQKGVRQIEKQLDLIHLLKTIRKLLFMQKLLLSKYQRKLIPFNSQNVLDKEKIEKQHLDSFQENSLPQLMEKGLLKLYLNHLLSNIGDSKIDRKLAKRIFQLESRKQKSKATLQADQNQDCILPSQDMTTLYRRQDGGSSDLKFFPYESKDTPLSSRSQQARYIYSSNQQEVEKDEKEEFWPEPEIQEDK